MAKISVVIPVYNSGTTLDELFFRRNSSLSDLVGKHYELIFVNDGSSDASWPKLKSLAASHSNTIAINLTRNFGQHNALMCGFSHSKGDVIVTIDDDLQIPPEEISKLYNEIVQSGQDVVYGTYLTKKHSFYRNFGSELVQWIYRKTFNMNFKITSFRIIRKEIIKLLLNYEKSFTYIDGLLCWFSNHMSTVNVEHQKRKSGKSGYSLSRLSLLALNMLTNFSIVPLQIASIVGIIFAASGFAFGIFFLLKKLFFDISVSGFASTIISITIFSGVQLLTVGILGEYIGRIHINVNKRPQYAIREIIDIQPTE
jgi:glycosyltransferase involved in cell wall biosynthesis